MKVVLCVVMMVLPSLWCETIILSNLTPEEAQAQLAARSLEVNYAKFLGENALSTGAERIYHNGRVLEHPEDFVQRTFQANQFHGQDGLGRTMFGYSDWNQGRLEARNANGEVRGSYQYVDANNENVIVNYWADRLGFHQMDNRKVAQTHSITETPEVQAARLAHQRAWDAAAAAAKENPDPMSDIYNANANKLDEEQSERDQAAEILSSVTRENQSRLPSRVFQNERLKSDVAINGDSVIVQAAESRRINQYERQRRQDSAEREATADDETISEPRGFFYNIDYPVNVLVEKDVSSASRKLVDPKLEAKVVQYKIVPIRVLDAKKFKRSQQGVRRRKAIKAEEKAVIQVPAAEDTPIETVQITKATENKISALPMEIPVAVQVDRKIAKIATGPIAASDDSVTSEIFKIKSIAEQESELKRLADDADLIDAVHDTQIHPKQSSA